MAIGPKTGSGCMRMWQVVACLLLSAALQMTHAHEHWIDVSDFRPVINTNVNVTICSGHYFPQSSFALKDKVFHGVELLSPDGATTSVETTVSGKLRAGAVAVKSGGVHVLRFTLKRPRTKGFSYEAKTILIAGTGTNDVGRYAVDRGLELVPLQPLAGLKPGEELPLVLLLDGQRVAGSLEAAAEGGKSSFLKTETDRPALLQLTRPGRYLVTANVKERGCSLVFWITGPPKEAP